MSEKFNDETWLGCKEFYAKLHDYSTDGNHFYEADPRVFNDFKNAVVPPWRKERNPVNKKSDLENFISMMIKKPRRKRKI